MEPGSQDSQENANARTRVDNARTMATEIQKVASEHQETLKTFPS